MNHKKFIDDFRRDKYGINLDGSIEKCEFKREPVFNLLCPIALNAVDPHILDPRSAWDDFSEYDMYSAKLVELFVDNFKTYGNDVSYLESAGPTNNIQVTI